MHLLGWLCYDLNLIIWIITQIIIHEQEQGIYQNDTPQTQ